MRKSSGKYHIVDEAFPVVLFFLFALCAIALLVLSVNFYKKTITRTDENTESRTATAYLRETIRQNQGEGLISKGSWEGTDTIEIASDNPDYMTLIFCSKGELKEAMVKRGTKVLPKDGQAIAKMKSLTVELENNQDLEITCQFGNGRSEKVKAHLLVSE